MIREMGNVELFELCETLPKVQCSQSLLYWNQGVICRICGHLLVESESRRKLNKLRLDALSVPHYVIKKERPRGASHGKTEAQKECHIAYNAWKRCCKRVDGQEEHYKGIHDRFLKRPSISWLATQNWLDREEVHRDGQVGTGWSLLPSIQRGIQEISRTVVSHIEHIGQQCADATSIRLSSCSLNQKPSPSRIRRRSRITRFSWTTSKMAPFFLKRFLVELGHDQKLVELMRNQFIFWKMFVAVGFVYSW